MFCWLVLLLLLLPREHVAPWQAWVVPLSALRLSISSWLGASFRLLPLPGAASLGLLLARNPLHRSPSVFTPGRIGTAMQFERSRVVLFLSSLLVLPPLVWLPGASPGLVFLPLLPSAVLCSLPSWFLGELSSQSTLLFFSSAGASPSLTYPGPHGASMSTHGTTDGR